jgi:MFS family permease
MVGAPFISMYLLQHVGMDLFHVLLLWTVAWVGGALLSNRLGSWAERFGQRPVLVLCTAFKSANMIALLCCPTNPQIAFWLLLPVFMVDAFLNAGILIATNGFLLKNSPSENRTMFIAAGTAFAGMAGGATSILAGALLAASDGWSLAWQGLHLVNFHVLFAVSIALRLAGIGVALGIREPSSTGARHVAKELVTAVQKRCARILLFETGATVEDTAEGDCAEPVVLRVTTQPTASRASERKVA